MYNKLWKKHIYWFGRSILSRFRDVWLQTGYGLVNKFIDYLYTPLGTALLQITDTHRLLTTVYYSLHSPFPVNGFYRGRFYSLPQSGPLVTVVNAELLSNDTSINWVSGWRPFHTKSPGLLFIGWISIENWTLSLNNQLLHVTWLNWLLTTDCSGVWVRVLHYDRRSVGQSVLE
jgi:hypothetical protein